MAKLLKTGPEARQELPGLTAEKVQVEGVRPQRDPRPQASGGTKDLAAETSRRKSSTFSEMQDKLYAQDRWGSSSSSRPWTQPARTAPSSTSCPASTRRGAGILVQGTSPEELDHDFLWRTSRCLPERGGSASSSLLLRGGACCSGSPGIPGEAETPSRLLTDRIWKERFEDISSFERYATRNGIAIRKFFLNVSRDEQKKRFLERLDNPDKNWKFLHGRRPERNAGATTWRLRNMICHTASTHAPWYVWPADNSGLPAWWWPQPSSRRWTT